jgi:hypothetical protein
VPALLLPNVTPTPLYSFWIATLLLVAANSSKVIVAAFATVANMAKKIEATTRLHMAFLFFIHCFFTTVLLHLISISFRLSSEARAVSSRATFKPFFQPPEFTKLFRRLRRLSELKSVNKVDNDQHINNPRKIRTC